MCSRCTALLVVVTRNACSGRKRPWVVVWWWEQGALAKGAAVMQELHLVKSTSFCSSSLILYHLFIPSLLLPLLLLVSALRQAWAEVLWRDEGCCCPRVGAVVPVPYVLPVWPQLTAQAAPVGEKGAFRWKQDLEKAKGNDKTNRTIAHLCLWQLSFYQLLSFRKLWRGGWGGEYLSLKLEWNLKSFSHHFIQPVGWSWLRAEWSHFGPLRG